MNRNKPVKKTPSAATPPSPGFVRNFFQPFQQTLQTTSRLFRTKTLWPPLFLELLLAVSMCMAYFFLVQGYSVGVQNNSTNYWVFSSCSLSNFHLEQLYDVWKGRLSGLMLSGYLFDNLVKNNTVKMDQYSTIFALYQSLWLFLLFAVIILALRRSLLINLGIFAGLMYNFSPASGLYFYPWDIPSTLFFTLAILFFERKQMWLMILATIIGCFFKETVLVCALLILMVDRWHWWRRILVFGLVFAVYVIGKKMLVSHLNLTVAALSMNGAKKVTDLLGLATLTLNLKAMFSLTANHVIFANAGTLVATMVLCWRKRYLPYLLVTYAFLAGQLMYGNFNEFRIFMQLLPLSLILLSERWQMYTEPALATAGTVEAEPERKAQAAKNNPGAAGSKTPVWSLRATFPLLSVLAAILMIVSVGLAGWQYHSVIEFKKPDHQARLVQTLLAKAQKGDAQSQFDLAKHYLSGEGTTVQPAEAFKWFQQAAEQGLPTAESQLGLCYIQGTGTEKDYVTGIPWFRKAAEKGENDAQYNLGILYENGMGVGRDLAEAAIWYQRAAEKGHILAQNNLGMICCNFRKDYVEAAKWFRLAADQGSLPSANSLGVIYLQGLGTKPDLGEAMKWLQKAADGGFTEAENNLALVYFSQQRNAEAAQWFHKAADQGHPDAECNLAQFFQKGLIYPQDLNEAMLWFTRSAKQGNAYAELALGKMYESGQGVKPDKVEAYKWFKIADLQNVPDAHNAATNCAATMSGDELSAADAEIQKMRNGGAP